LYTHRAIKKQLTPQIQTPTPRLTVTKRTGRRTSSATPIQKREKRAAVTRERERVPITKERKMRIGVAERRNWIRRKL
jgi:hypothetical protein